MGKKKKEIVIFRGQEYEVLERAGETIRIGNSEEQFCVLEVNTEKKDGKDGR